MRRLAITNLLLNAKPPDMSWQRSGFNEVNDSCHTQSSSWLFLFVFDTDEKASLVWSREHIFVSGC